MTDALTDRLDELGSMSGRGQLAVLDEMERSARNIALPGAHQPVLDQLSQIRRLVAGLVVQTRGIHSQVSGGRLIGEGPATTATTGDRPPSHPP